MMSENSQPCIYPYLLQYNHITLSFKDLLVFFEANFRHEPLPLTVLLSLVRTYALFVEISFC